MNKLIKILFVITFMLFSSSVIKAQNDTDAKSKSFNVKSGGTLSVSISSGDIKISTWDKNEVSVKINGDNNDDLNNIQVSLEGNTVKVKNRNSYSWGFSGNIHIIIGIPADFNTEITTQSGDVTQTGSLKGTTSIFTAGGDISIGNVTGKTTLKSNGGDITTGNIGDELNLSTNGGDVKTGFISGKAGINTMGGSIDVNGTGKDISLNTMGGDINAGNIGGNADVKTMGGSIGLGKVNGNANISTYGGDISLSGANGSVDATTFGGSIKMTNITGSVNADTKSGDIYIELKPSGNTKSKIKSLNGTVSLFIPSNAKANITATVSGRNLGRNSDKELLDMIHSDFESKSLVTDDRRGDKIVATYVLNGGGGAVIEIYSVNGNIEIRKK